MVRQRLSAKNKYKIPKKILPYREGNEKMVWKNAR